MPGATLFDAMPGGVDPGERTEAAHRTASLLVRGARNAADEELISRIIHLADDQGLDTVADLWADSPADTLPGVLWRLYLLRAWVQADPAGAAREFDAGRKHAEVHEVIAGVVQPPGADEVRELADLVMRGVVTGDFATTLDRAAAFARVTAAGRGELSGQAPVDQGTARAVTAVRLVRLADQLETAARLERAGSLG